VKRELEALRTRALSAGQRERLDKTLEFITHVVESISTPQRRSVYDAEHGNFRGVARCMSAGLTVTEMEKQRKIHLASHPGAEAKAQIGLVSGRAWENKGSAAEAMQEYERALVIDPLNLQLQQRYWSLKRKPS
jgi:serine/threonine-protein kinase